MKKYGELTPNEKLYPSKLVDEFLTRRKEILKYGLWMTKRLEDDFIETRTNNLIMELGFMGRLYKIL